jgi:ketosteroid isomerase-like protein
MFTPKTEPEQTVLNFFQSLGGGDWEATRALMDENIVWTVMARGVPGEGEHHGADAILAFIRPVRALFAPGSPEITLRSIVSAGNLVIMEAHGGGRLLGGRAYDNHYVMALEVHDGRVSAIREYMDSYYVHELLNGG